jgi:hypothetical protein
MSKDDDKKSTPRKPNFELDENAEITQESWNRVMNWYEDYNDYERMAVTLAPELKKMEKRAAELKAEADKEREERMENRAKIEKTLEQKQCHSCGIESSKMRGKKIVPLELKGKWICQKCAGCVCKKCGAPLKYAPGHDYIDEAQMKILHSPMLPVNYTCIDDCDGKKG